MSKKILKHAIINAGVTGAYILLVAAFLNNIESIFGYTQPDDTILAPVIMLLLFVISAAITGFAVFGKPIMWYLDGKKKEATHLLFYTIVVLVVIALFFITMI